MSEMTLREHLNIALRDLANLSLEPADAIARAETEITGALDLLDKAGKETRFVEIRGLGDVGEVLRLVPDSEPPVYPNDDIGPGMRKGGRSGVDAGRVSRTVAPDGFDGEAW